MNTAGGLLMSPDGVASLHRLFAPVPLAAIVGIATSHAGFCEPGQSSPPDPRITPGQVIDGWTGLPIPCRCRFRGQTYRLGDVICMSTHLGKVLTRCELFLNNTSWMPTKEPCTVSQSDPAVQRASVSP